MIRVSARCFLVFCGANRYIFFYHITQTFSCNNILVDQYVFSKKSFPERSYQELFNGRPFAFFIAVKIEWIYLVRSLLDFSSRKSDVFRFSTIQQKIIVLRPSVWFVQRLLNVLDCLSNLWDFEVLVLCSIVSVLTFMYKISRIDI